MPANPWTTFTPETLAQLKAQLKPVLIAYGQSRGFATRRIGMEVFVSWSPFSYDLVDIKYENLKPVVMPDAVAYTDFSNDSSTEDAVKWTISAITTDTFTWSLKEGLKAGASTSFKVGAPFIAEGKIEVSAELSFEANQIQTVTKTRSWSEELTLKIPPFSNINATAMVMTAKYDTPFEARLRLHGEIWFEQGEHNWGKQERVRTDDPAFRQFLSPDARELIVSVKGQWTGAFGIKLVGKKKETKLEEMVRDFAEQVSQNFEAWKAAGDEKANEPATP